MLDYSTADDDQRRKEKREKKEKKRKRKEREAESMSGDMHAVAGPSVQGGAETSAAGLAFAERNGTANVAEPAQVSDRDSEMKKMRKAEKKERKRKQKQQEPEATMALDAQVRSSQSLAQGSIMDSRPEQENPMGSMPGESSSAPDDSRKKKRKMSKGHDLSDKVVHLDDGNVTSQGSQEEHTTNNMQFGLDAENDSALLDSSQPSFESPGKKKKKKRDRKDQELTIDDASTAVIDPNDIPASDRHLTRIGTNNDAMPEQSPRQENTGSSDSNVHAQNGSKVQTTAEALDTSSPSKTMGKSKSKKKKAPDTSTDVPPNSTNESSAEQSARGGHIAFSPNEERSKGGKKRAVNPEDEHAVGDDTWHNSENSIRKRGRKKLTTSEEESSGAESGSSTSVQAVPKEITQDQHTSSHPVLNPISSNAKAKNSKIDSSNGKTAEPEKAPTPQKPIQGRVAPSLDVLNKIARSSNSGSTVKRASTVRAPRNETNLLHSKEATVADARGLRAEDILADRLYQSHQLRWLQEELGLEYKLGAYSKTEDEQIERAMLDFGLEHGLDWQQVLDLMFNTEAHKGELLSAMYRTAARSVPGRSNRHVRKHLWQIYHPDGHGGAWSAEEIEKLREAVEKNAQDWVEVGKAVGRRGADCRLRWRDQMRSRGKNEKVDKVKGAWTDEESTKLRKVVEEYCMELSIDIEKRESIKWTTISTRMGSERNANSCYQRWCVMLDKGLWDASDDLMLLRRLSEQTDAVENNDITMVKLRELQTDQWRFSPKTMRRNWQRLVKNHLNEDNYKANFANNLARLNDLRSIVGPDESLLQQQVPSPKKKRKSPTKKTTPAPALDVGATDEIDSEEEV